VRVNPLYATRSRTNREDPYGDLPPRALEVVDAEGLRGAVADYLLDQELDRERRSMSLVVEEYVRLWVVAGAGENILVSIGSPVGGHEGLHELARAHGVGIGARDLRMVVDVRRDLVATWANVYLIDGGSIVERGWETDFFYRALRRALRYLAAAFPVLPSAPLNYWSPYGGGPTYEAVGDLADYVPVNR
jgi:hypothetical protein